jgi:hypothetical protein
MKIFLKQSCLLALGILIASAANTHAAEQVQFGRKLAAGEKYNFTQTMVMDNAITVSANGQVVQNVQQKMTQNRVGTTTIDTVDDKGRPTKATYTFDKSSGGEMTMAGQPAQPIPSSLAGKTVTVVRTGEKDLSFNPDVDQAGQAELTEMFLQEHTLLPSKPVTVGDSWDIDPSELKSMMPPGGQMEAKAKGKLLSVENTGGRQVATVEFTISMDGGVQGMTMKSDLTGKGTVDVVSGQPIDIEITGPIKGSGRQQTPNGAVDIAMEGKMTMNLKAKREGGGGGAGAGGNPGISIPAVAGNPLAGAPDFAGTYSNADTTVKLVSGVAGWTGTIKKGDKEFPISKATTNGSRITGKFTAGGDSFDFDATLDGKTLTLSTGGATYTLTRAASANPLGQ